MLKIIGIGILIGIGLILSPIIFNILGLLLILIIAVPIFVLMKIYELIKNIYYGIKNKIRYGY